MPFLLILGAAGAAWYFGVWPFDGRTWKPKDTAYMAEVAYYVGKEIAYDNGSKRKTLQECRSDADNLASYRGRNSPTRVISQTCIVYINGEPDHRE